MKSTEFSVLFIITSLFWSVSCWISSYEISNFLNLYEVNINESVILSRSGKELLKHWSEGYQVEVVDVTTKYRIQMTKHKEHSFKGTVNSDKKWNQCLDFYSYEVERSEDLYYEREVACLKVSNDEGKDKKQSINQVEKEIKKWRKSYNYLSQLCELDHAKNKRAAEACLVDYIEKDHYNVTLQRLMQLKIDAMKELYVLLRGGIKNLNECLRVTLSEYLDRIRSQLITINTCFNGRRRDNNGGS